MLIILPVGVDYNARRYPVVTFTLMGLCTAVYIVTLGFTLENGHPAVLWVMQHLWLIPDKSYWWTYLTSMFVHGGLFHLLGNMVFLFLFGSCVEDIIGRVAYTAFYLICGLVAEFAYIAMSPEHFASSIPMGGASGAISGCVGGFMLLLLKTRVEFKYLGMFFFRPFSGDFSLPAWIVVSAWFLKDLVGAVIAMNYGSGHGGVAFGAHVGGTLCGLGLIALEKLRTNASRPVTARPSAPIEAQDVYLFSDGAQIGPFTPSQIRGMMALGSLATGTVYWKEGMEDWRAVEEL